MFYPMDARDIARNPRVQDPLLAGGFTAAVVFITGHIDSDATSGRHLDILGWTFVGLAGLALAGLRSAPVATLLVATVAVSGYTVWDYPGGPVYVSVLIAVAGVAWLRPRRAAISLTTGSGALIVTAGFIRAGGTSLEWVHLVFLGWAAAALLLGDTMRSRQHYLRERAHETARKRQDEASRRAVEERLRIARDVHDIVAHSLATISVQAGAAEHVFERRPEEAREVLASIRKTSNEALLELRATLEDLRRDGDTAPRHPLAGLANLDELVASAERSGLRVAVDITGHRFALPSSADNAAYRIVQEALTNVVRHADAASARVSLRYGLGELGVEVVDTGRGSNLHDIAGHGLRGMEERARLMGGSLQYGPNPGGGFRVVARLPAGES